MQEEQQKIQPEITSPTLQSQSILLKDLIIPISIVIAGALVGMGLYFSGAPIEKDIINQVAENPASNTEKINPITKDDHIRGNLDAPIKIVEYSDYDCPFCSRFHDVMNSIVEKYTGEEVAWVLRQFPLEQLHPQAPAVALASECVAELGGNDAFWIFSDGYFASRGKGEQISHEDLIPRLVLEAKVSKKEFTECFESKRLTGLVQEDADDAIETGGRGTPWSIIVGPTGKTYPINGALPQNAIEQLIEVAKKEA